MARQQLAVCVFVYKAMPLPPMLGPPAAIALQSVASMGRVAEFFIDRVSCWQTVLSTVEATLRMWLHVQRRWLSLVRAPRCAPHERSIVWLLVCPQRHVNYDVQFD